MDHSFGVLDSAGENRRMGLAVSAILRIRNVSVELQPEEFESIVVFDSSQRAPKARQG
jgi:hypothetical protein